MLIRKKKTSRVQRASWMLLAAFFVVFCSCPVKRLIRIELGLPVPPLSMPVSATGDHDANNIKDCNITKHDVGQKIVMTTQQQSPDLSLPPAFLFASYISAASDLYIKAGKLTGYTSRQYTISDGPLLYLRHGRLQV